jgi:hypothetical protein
MINNLTMYQLYKEALLEKSKAILASCTISELEYEMMVELFDTIKSFHPEYKEVKSITDLKLEDIEKLRISPSQFLFIKSYLLSISVIKQNKEKALLINKVKINNTHFNFILLTFNRLLWKAMIEKSYVFKHKFIGSLQVVCRENEMCKPKLKWKESLANKKAIEEKGGKPRIELEAKTAEFKEEDYKGEEWIERHDPFNVTIKWRRSTYANLKVPTIKDFTMKLCRTGKNNGVVNALKEARDNNKLEDLLIKYYKANG